MPSFIVTAETKQRKVSIVINTTHKERAAKVAYSIAERRNISGYELFGDKGLVQVDSYDKYKGRRIL